MCIVGFTLRQDIKIVIHVEYKITNLHSVRFMFHVIINSQKENLMSKATYVLAALMGSLTAGAGFASFTGSGLTQPIKEPQSIRAGSARNSDGTWGRSSYFIYGGGLHGGK